MSLQFNFSHSYSGLPEIFFSKAAPAPVQNPELLIFNEALAKSLDLETQSLDKAELALIFSGAKPIAGANPIAQAYAGHQFANFTMLGDGRAHLLGEHVNKSGQRFDIQLKGSGITPYSRGGDGKAAVGPMLREFLISEAMHALGIPTTRSLAVVGTNEPVFRENVLPGAILTRIAQSHLRVGTFQFAAAFGGPESVKALLEYTINRHYPHLKGAENPALELLRAVIERQAETVAQWMLVGFIHGVMNTDNMSLTGETIDYGPCAFLDHYDPATVFSSIDYQGRYAFGNQPRIAQWNLARLAEALLSEIAIDQKAALELAQHEIQRFPETFQRNWLTGMTKKLGLFDVQQDDESLITELLELMQESQSDFTNTFRNLDSTPFSEWQKKWKSRLSRQSQSPQLAQELMNKSNPVVIPRNHKVEEALGAAAEGSLEKFNRILEVLRNPFTEQVAEEFLSPRPLGEKPFRTFCGT